MPAIASIQSPFGTPGTQTPIGRYSSGDPLPDAVTRTYTLHVAVSDFRHLNFAYIKPLPPVPYNVKDLPLDMRVYDQNNKIELQLDTSNVDWYFDTSAPDVVTVGVDKTLPHSPTYYYYALTFGPSNPKCTLISFYARRCDDVDPSTQQKFVNKHPFTIRVLLDQDVGGVTTTTPLVLYIDPGIKNPGDGPGG